MAAKDMPFPTDLGRSASFANPGSTDSYIVCSDGVAYQVQCDAGTVYKDAIKACDD